MNSHCERSVDSVKTFLVAAQIKPHWPLKST